MNCGPPGSSVHGILRTRILEGVAISFSKGTSPPRDRTPVSWASCAGRRVLYHRATGKPSPGRLQMNTSQQLIPVCSLLLPQLPRSARSTITLTAAQATGFWLELSFSSLQSRRPSPGQVARILPPKLLPHLLTLFTSTAPGPSHHHRACEHVHSLLVCLPASATLAQPLCHRAAKLYFITYKPEYAIALLKTLH